MSCWPEIKATTHEDGWVERHGCFEKIVAGTFRLSVSWSMDREKPGYVVTVCSRQLKENSPDAEHGKKRAVAFLKKILDQAAKEIS